MWTDFKQQAHELQQLLADKQAVACDRDAARAELCRLQELLQQQKQLQEAYASQQQVLLALQRQDQQQQQPLLGALGASAWHQQQQQQQQDDDQEGRWDAQDSLDAFVVETQMVGGHMQPAAPFSLGRCVQLHAWGTGGCTHPRPCPPGSMSVWSKVRRSDSAAADVSQVPA